MENKQTNTAEYWASKIASSIQAHADNGLLTQAQADELKGGLN